MAIEFAPGRDGRIGDDCGPAEILFEGEKNLRDFRESILRASKRQPRVRKNAVCA
jgi:hypothetical protein